MNATQYIATFIRPEYLGDARVITQHAKRGVHVVLQPEQNVPDGDDSFDVFIQMKPLSTQRTDPTTPEAIVDTPVEHNCNEAGEVCKDHPDQVPGHSGCYGSPVYCTYTEDGRVCFKAEVYAAARADKEPEDVGHEKSDALEPEE